MFTRVLSSTVSGVSVVNVWVEVDVSDGLPVFLMVGYLSSQVKEAQDRVRTALRNAEISMPPKRITINMAPADVRKEGARFDLPIAIAILAASGFLPKQATKGILILGELGLDGKICDVKGVLPSVIYAKECGYDSCMVPALNYKEAKSVEGVKVIGVSNLQEAIDYFKFGKIHEIDSLKEEPREEDSEDFSDIYGQELVKRAAEISVSGFHNLLLIGPPGSGKSMLAKRILGLLPKLSLEESIEISKIYSIAGLLPKGGGLKKQRPLRAPHHTVSPQALAGGGRFPSPGEITLAHRGILFLDEMPEFSRKSLEILRQPMEEHKITISRSQGSYEFPAHFLLLAAMNPCPCGFYPDMNRCSCQATQINQYKNRISQPLLDRIDLCVEAAAISYDEIKGRGKSGESSKIIRERVFKVHQIQRKRYKNQGIFFNGELRPKEIKEYCMLSKEAEGLLEKSFEKLKLSARGYHRILKVARTIADMEESDIIDVSHIQEAICYRSIDKKYWK